MSQWRVEKSGPQWLMDLKARLVGLKDNRGGFWAIPLTEMTEAALNALVDPVAADGGGGGGSSYLGTVASQAAMLALSAVVGSTCLRSDLGTGGTPYQCIALPATSAANWQPLQGIMTDGSVVSITLVPGQTSYVFALYVPTGNRVTPTVDGVTKDVIVESTQLTFFVVEDEPGVASPALVTFQRTTGSDATGYWSLLIGG